MFYAKRFQPLLSVVVVLAFFSIALGQGRSPNRDQTRAIERAEMDRLLLWALPANKESEATRLARFKKIKEDFRDLQSLNNKMMADAWAQEALDYKSISETVSKIRERANDLKTTLNLPEPAKQQKPSEIPEVTSARQFRSELLLLDQTIMRFVNNPVFQAVNTLDVNKAREARHDLETVILLIANVKQNAAKLRPNSNP
jgi:hypothetical protein